MGADPIGAPQTRQRGRPEFPVVEAPRQPGEARKSGRARKFSLPKHLSEFDFSRKLRFFLALFVGRP